MTPPTKPSIMTEQSMDLIAKKYRVLKELGQGAMGEVYLVLPPRGEPVALKLLKTADTKNIEHAIQQFENEFKVLKKLSHPNIGQLYDFGFDIEQKKVYFTSPWLKGTDIYVATKDLPFEKQEAYFVQLLRALNYLHQKNIIHCDLKPGNIYVEDDQVLLIDFGLAGYWGESIVGTPTYLAPEIYRGGHHSVQSDLYAVGVILYNCLTRTQPFSGKSMQEVYDRHRTHTPAPISQLNKDIPKYLSDIALTLLSKKQEERYSSASAVIEEIAAYSKTKYTVETKETLLSYVPTTSELIGRKEAQWHIENQVGNFLKKTTSYFGLFLHGEAGTGKTKFIHQIKTQLQLEKISIEDVRLPLSESDQKMLGSTECLVLDNVEDYLEGDDKAKQDLAEFISFLERKILSPETTRFLFIVGGTKETHWKPFEALFPPEDFLFQDVQIPSFNFDETKAFLESIIGSKEIPEKFIREIFQNTGGNPGICQNIVETLIQQGLLFDGSGRWSEDLIVHLEDILKKMATPKSLEEKLREEYGKFSYEEREIVHWLALAPHGLTEKMLHHLVPKAKEQGLLETLLKSNVIREEGKRYVLYRSSYIPFIDQRLSSGEKKDRHTRLAEEEIDMAQKEVWYHLSHGWDPQLVESALENLGEALIREGRREEALECYNRLRTFNEKSPLGQRIEWTVKAAEILIWLDRFNDASEVLTKSEEELVNHQEEAPLKTRLLLLEKKGVAFLHQQKFEYANEYFAEGLRQSEDQEETKVEEIRFQNNLAQIEWVQGRTEEAIKKFTISREWAKKLSARDVQKVTNNDLGHVYYQIKDYDKAISLLQDDVRNFSVLANREPVARALYSLAEALRAKKKYQKALREYERCVYICQKENLLPILLRAYNGLGNIHLMKGNSEKALESYQRAIDISVRVREPTTKAALLANQGLIYRKQKNWPQASRRFLLAKQILEQKERKIAYEYSLMSKCYSELSAIAQEENNNLKALSFQVEKMQMVENSETLKPEEFSVKLELARLYLENRLGEPFKVEINKLQGLAKTPAEIEKVSHLKKSWDEIESFDQDSTTKVG